MSACLISTKDNVTTSNFKGRMMKQFIALIVFLIAATITSYYHKEQLAIWLMEHDHYGPLA